MKDETKTFCNSLVFRFDFCCGRLLQDPAQKTRLSPPKRDRQVTDGSGKWRAHKFQFRVRGMHVNWRRQARRDSTQELSSRPFRFGRESKQSLTKSRQASVHNPPPSHNHTTQLRFANRAELLSHSEPVFCSFTANRPSVSPRHADSVAYVFAFTLYLRVRSL